MQGVLSNYTSGTVGMLVAPSKSNFSWRTKTRAFLSGYKIILTDKNDMISDMDEYILNKSKSSNRNYYLYITDFIKISLLLYIAYMCTYIYLKK